MFVIFLIHIQTQYRSITPVYFDKVEFISTLSKRRLNTLSRVILDCFREGEREKVERLFRKYAKIYCVHRLL